MARVLVFGTFDVLHPGHIHALYAAARRGQVTVVLTSDVLCRKLKQLAAVNPYRQRAERLGRLRVVDNIVPTDPKLGSYRVLKQHQPDVIVLGHDQRSLHSSLKQEAGWSGEVVVSPPYRRGLYRSSRFRKLASKYS